MKDENKNNKIKMNRFRKFLMLVLMKLLIVMPLVVSDYQPTYGYRQQTYVFFDLGLSGLISILRYLFIILLFVALIIAVDKVFPSS